MHHKPNGDIGQKAIDLVGTFPATFPNVSHFYFKTYRPVPGVKDRLNVSDLSIQELQARCLDPATLIEEMLRHVNDNEPTPQIEVPAKDLVWRLPELVAECKVREEMLAVYSVCRENNGRELHIPMMDFQLKSGSDVGRISLLRTAIKGVRQQHGVLLDSGNSYHYYGLRLLTEQDWRWFMVGCLLLEPLVDVRYISHRLLACKGALRLTSRPGKSDEPSVVSYLS
jgi:hypothetical protein